MKRLVICCDGTWERIYRGALTNVALTARSIAPRDATGQPQIVYYSCGVGASLGGLSMWDGMTGADLDQHLLDAYLFLNFIHRYPSGLGLVSALLRQSQETLE